MLRLRSFIALPLLVVLTAGAPARRGGPDRPADLAAARLRAAEVELAQERRGPRGIVPLARLEDLEDDAPDLSVLARAYADAAADPATDAEIRGLARFRLAAVERARGNLQRSARELGKLGLVTRWKVIGPFDDEGKRAHERVLPPEQALDLEARLPGKVREVTWRDLPEEALVDGFVHLGAVLRPSREVAALAVAFPEAQRDERVVLWYGGSGAAKVWVNGALAVTDPGYHLARPDQRGARVSLRKGPNVILVKLCHQDGRMGFWLRLTDPRGEGRAYATAAPGARPAAGGAGQKPSPVEGVVARLERKAASARGRAEAAARYDLAVALAERRSADGEERRASAQARRAVELAPTWREARLLAARLEDDHGPRRQHLDAALEAAPDDPEVLLAVARDEADQGRPHAAVRLLDRALAAAPGWVAPRVLRVEALARAGEDARATLEGLELAVRYPTVPDAVRAASRSARRLGRLDDAASRLRTLLALRFDDHEARATLASLLLDRGDLAGSLALHEEGLRLDPSDVQRRLLVGDLLAANGRADEAEAAYAGALRLAPEEGEALERRGRARLSAGKAAEAVQDLERALELRPQVPALKELVQSLKPARERFEAPYALDARALVAGAGRPPRNEDALVLGELQVTRVYPSGLSATFHQQVTRVLTTRGADAFRRHSIGWTPDRQDVKVERARVLKPDGSVIETFEESERSASEPWYRLYYDTRVKTLSFPALAAGDVLEVAWRVEDTAGENLLSDYFGDLTFIDDPVPKKLFEYVLLVPGSRPISSNTPEDVEHTTRSLDGGLVEHRWTARDLAKLEPEPGMPGWSEVARHLHVSTYESWEQVARFYEGLVRDPLRPGEEVRSAARKLAEQVLESRRQPPPREGQGQSRATTLELPPPGGWDRETKRALVDAAYGFVVSQTRYVGLEFGIHGFKPYRVDQVLQRRFGDCKDKASLLHALLEAMGIESRLVLLRMRRLGAMPELPASLAIFNHAIAYVPDLDLWLDGTASHSGTGDLPGEDRGATVLVLEPGKPPVFGTVPAAGPSDNQLTTTFEVALATDGRATVKGHSRVTGVQAPEYRRAYLAEGDRRALLEQAFNRTFPGLQVQEVAISDLTLLEEPVAMSFAMEVPRYARPDGDGLLFTPFGVGARYAEAYASLSSRKHDLVLGDPSETRFTYRYTLPPGWEATDLPEPASADGPQAGFAVTYRQDGQAVVAEGHVTFKTGRIPAGDYKAFRELLGRVDRAFDRKVRIAPGRSEVKP
jgi:tetratricopeptide (TPR) repeat protein